MDGKNTQGEERSAALLQFWTRWGADLLLVLGAAAITAGAAMVYLPAGLIIGGVLSIAGGVLAARGGGGEL